MSRARIAVATASVLLGLAGAAIVLKTAGTGGDGASADVPDKPTIALVHTGSSCMIDRRAGVVVFTVVVRNAGNQDQATRLHPSVGLSDGSKLSLSSSDETASLLATEQRTYEIEVPYEPGSQRPNRCQVALGDGAQAPIAVRQAS